MIDIRVNLKFNILENGRLVGTTETNQEFKGFPDLAEALVSFGAQNCFARLSPEVRALYTRGGSRLIMPKVENGFGPWTCLVITEMNEVK